jgi:hypothetical protein
MALVAATSALIALGPTMAAAALAADPTIVVQSGDTLTAISRRVNVPMSELIALNALADPTASSPVKAFGLGRMHPPRVQRLWRPPSPHHRRPRCTSFRRVRT